MKRGTLFGRMIVVYGLVVVAGIGVGVLTVQAALAPAPPAVSPEEFSRDSLLACAILDPRPIENPYMARLDSMPPGGIRLDVDRSISHGREFNDSNYLHLNAANVIGIQPIDNEMDAWNVDRPIVREIGRAHV